MFLMYIDESGDIGLNNSHTDYFVLTGIVLHELRWRDALNQLIDFRRRMLRNYGLLMHDEIHASDFINSPGPIARISKNDRLGILRLFAQELVNMPYLNIINVKVNKVGKAADYDVFFKSWQALIQRFENTIKNNNFNGPSNPEDMGMLIPDNTDMSKLTTITRRMRYHNPVPNTNNPGYRNILITSVIEDPNFRNSTDSYFIQAADLCAYLLYQFNCPNKYMRSKAGHKYFLRLDPILCKAACHSNQYGIVEL